MKRTQDNSFHKLSKRQQRKLSIDDYIEYMKKERIYEYECGKKIQGITKSKLWHYFLMNLLVVNRMINHQNIHIVADNRVRKRKPVIYACTHIGYSDVVIAFSAIKKPCWLFMGNPEVNCRTMDGWLAEKMESFT